MGGIRVRLLVAKKIKLYCLGGHKMHFHFVYLRSRLLHSMQFSPKVVWKNFGVQYQNIFLKSTAAFVIKCNQPRSIQVYFYFDCVFGNAAHTLFWSIKLRCIRRVKYLSLDGQSSYHNLSPGLFNVHFFFGVWHLYESSHHLILWKMPPNTWPQNRQNKYFNGSAFLDGTTLTF